MLNYIILCLISVYVASSCLGYFWAESQRWLLVLRDLDTGLSMKPVMGSNLRTPSSSLSWSFKTHKVIASSRVREHIFRQRRKACIHRLYVDHRWKGPKTTPPFYHYLSLFFHQNATRQEEAKLKEGRNSSLAVPFDCTLGSTWAANQSDCYSPYG